MSHAPSPSRFRVSGGTLETTYRVVREDGRFVALVGLVHDVTAQQAERDRLAHLASHDDLTGLANRPAFETALKQALAQCGRTGKHLALLFLDLDRFKHINDTHGHPVGDRLLKAVADRLAASVRQTDVVARFGGDEFAIAQTHVAGPQDAVQLARKILERLAAPFELDGHAIYSGTSIGIALYPDDAPDGDALLEKADLALYQAKRLGRGTFQFFSAALDEQAKRRLTLEHELPGAVARGELAVSLAPWLPLRAGVEPGAEATLRWRHPTLGDLGQEAFWAIAEDIHEAARLDAWLLEAACREAARRPEGGRVAVQLSAMRVREPALDTLITGALSQADLPADRLELRLDEAVAAGLAPEPAGALTRVHAAGVHLVLSRFGAGGAGLDVLARLPFDALIAAPSLTSAESDRLLSAVRAVASALGLQLGAASVATAPQLEALRAHDFDRAEGPLPAGWTERRL